MNHYEQAKRILKAEMVRNGISTKELASRLQALGTPEAVGSLKTKISRGRFQVAFLLHCLAAMDVKEIHIIVPTREEVLMAGFDQQYNHRPGPTAKREAKERSALLRKASRRAIPRVPIERKTPAVAEDDAEEGHAPRQEG